jgi:hypothetical protein
VIQQHGQRPLSKATLQLELPKHHVIAVFERNQHQRQPITATTITTTMDYSAAEASPWGNSPSSSPRRDRTAFSAGAGEPPNSPFRYPSSNNGLPDEGGFGASDSEYHRPDTASTVSQSEEPQTEEAASAEPESHPSQQQSFAGEQGPLSPQPPAQQQQQQAPPHTRDQPQRAQERPQQPRKPPPPQFKLQAKITGLERTGRKDPILRFDVHVRPDSHVTRKIVAIRKFLLT